MKRAKKKMQKIPMTRKTRAKKKMQKMPITRKTMTMMTDNFLTKTMQTASLQSKGQKQGGLGTGVEVLEKEQNALETAPVGLQEGAGGQSFIVLCFPKGVHSCPRVRDNYTAASQ